MAKGVPRKKKGESVVAYHDRLASLARDLEKAGDTGRSRRVQKVAGELAAKHEDVARRPRAGKRHGPGTYPWYECVEDQRARGYSEQQANEICGRIRADSRERYPAYWQARKGAENPLPLVPLIALGAHAASEAAASGVARHIGANPAVPADGAPFCAITLDAGPHFGHGPRDHILVLDRAGNILEVWENGGPEDLARFNADHPGLPVFGPFRVIAPDVRNARRRARRLVRSTI